MTRSSESISLNIPWLQKLILVLLVLVAYVNVLSYDYNIDDNLVTQKHPLTSKGLSSIKEIFTSNYYSNKADIRFGYRPLTHVSFAIEHQFFGEHPLVSHAINLILFILCVLLFYKLLSRWASAWSYPLAFFAAALFAIHPVHTEVVDSIKNRDELLAFLFLMGSFTYACKFVHARSLVNILMISLCFALGMLAKKSIYTMVFILPVTYAFLLKADFKTCAMALFAMLIPAACIGSGFEVKNLMLMIIAPLFTMVCIYLYSRVTQAGIYIKAISTSFSAMVLSFICIAIVIGFAFINQQIVYTLLSLPFVWLILGAKKEWAVWPLLVCMCLVGVLFKNTTVSIFALSIATGYIYHKWHTKKKGWVDVACSVLIFAVYMLGAKFNIGLIALVGVLNLFLLLLYKKTPWAVVFSILVLVGAYFLFEVHIYMIAFLVYSGFTWLNKNSRIKLQAQYLLLFLITLALVWVSFRTQSVQQVYRMHFTTNTTYDDSKRQELRQVQKESIFNEGRSLHYIENTLVSPHSKAETVATGFTTLSEYLRLMFFPRELSFYYGYAKNGTSSFSDPLVWFSLIFHAGLIILAITQLNKRPLISVGIAWYLVNILLFSNWVELVAGMIGERLAFTASAGFCLFIAALIFWLKPNINLRNPGTVELVFIGVIILCTGRTIARNNDWKDALTLMQHDIEHLDRSAYAHHALGANLMYVSTSNNKLSNEEAGSMQLQAIDHFRRSIQIYPDFFNAHFDLARVYIANADHAHAKEALLGAYQLDSTNLFVLEELAKTSFELKQVAETEKYANLFLVKEPANENVHEILAYIMLINGRKPEAKKYAQRGLGYFPANKNLNMMLRDAGK